MKRWPQGTFVPIVFSLAAIVLMLTSQANAQSQTALPSANVGGAWETRR
jgi:hypothetical protein